VGILLDAHALLALLRAEPGADEVELILRQGNVSITAVNLAEALDVLVRRDGVPEETVREVLEPLLGTGLDVVAVGERDAWRAASLRSRHYRRREGALSLADCFLLAAGEREEAIATDDEAVIAVARAEGIGVAPLRGAG
jgi:PIN domain nuclease of toxin-antitoxin system